MAMAASAERVRLSKSMSAACCVAVSFAGGMRSAASASARITRSRTSGCLTAAITSPVLAALCSRVATLSSPTGWVQRRRREGRSRGAAGAPSGIGREGSGEKGKGGRDREGGE
eukprot:scaffold129776_cov30-Tisochrysis_lutea.AAC.1